MNCENCGALMVVVGDAEYFFCEYCGAFHFPELSTEGIRIFDLSPDDLRCPACESVLSRASIDSFAGLHCQKCRGILLDQIAFGELVKVRRARVTGPPDRPRPLDRAQLKRQLRCSHCGELMTTHPYYGPGNIVVDTCLRCHVIWLDVGEMVSFQKTGGKARQVEPFPYWR